MKNNKAITLVALVITIIILLILAGITISQLTGSGLFENAKLAEGKSKNAQELENSILADYQNEIGKYIYGNREENNNDNIHIEKGSIDISFSSSWRYITIEFEKEYNEIPEVYYKYNAGTSGGSVYVKDVTTTSFQIGYNSFFKTLHTDTIEWIAIEKSTVNKKE